MLRSAFSHVLLWSYSPSIVLNIALSNLFATLDALRVAAYALLSRASLSFDFEQTSTAPIVSGLAIATNHAALVGSISETLAASAPRLTLDLLLESFRSLRVMPTPQSLAYLLALRPWYQNIASAALVGSPDAVAQAAKVEEIIKRLVHLGQDASVRSPLPTICSSCSWLAQLFSILQSRIWPVLAKMDDLAPVVLDGLVDEATRYSDPRTELARTPDIAAAVSSLSLRGKLITRLRAVRVISLRLGLTDRSRPSPSSSPTPTATL